MKLQLHLFICLMMFWGFVGCSLWGGGSPPQPPQPQILSYSNYIRAYEAGDGDLVKELFNRATELRAGLEFPRDTFAVDRERGILIAHAANGLGVIDRGVGQRLEMFGDDYIGRSIVFEKRGNLRVLTHYQPWNAGDVLPYILPHYQPNAGSTEQNPRPDPRLSFPEQIKKWLMERNYQIKKEGNGYKITRKDARFGNVYDVDIEMSASSATHTVGEVSFTGNENGTISIRIDGIGTAAFEVDWYGNLHSVEGHNNR